MKLEMRVIGIDKIRPNPFQPRETFEKESIRELAESIKEVGLLQPILVRPDKSNYQIISGERRWRASQFAGLKEIPVIIKEVDDKRLLIESLVENVHRKDLEPIEKGRALFELGQILGFFDEEGAPKVEKKRIYEELSSKTKVSLNDVERHLGLLELPEYIQREIVSVGRKPAEGKITEHHARVLRGIKDEELQKKVVQKIKEEKLTGVETEKLGKVLKKAPKPLREAVLKPKSEITPEVAREIIKIPEETQRELLREVEERELPTEEIH
ncbi:MAG: ParB/RepB/Spo0J family partition protein, partial [Candidatus Methanofastidiosia archaeon]